MAVGRRRQVASAGHRGDLGAVQAGLGDPDPGVRAVAVGALRRVGGLSEQAVGTALEDPAPAVRRRACEEVAWTGSGAWRLAARMTACLSDPDAGVVEAACFALGETMAAGSDGAGGPSPDAPGSRDGCRDGSGAVGRLARTAVEHPDPLCREAAVAALGSIGDPSGLPAILAATADRPAVRRRAVLALAPFEGPDVDQAVARALGDRDWQVRQAAEDMGATAGR
ncbi:MAG: HEAT repeat domain-containing protein [Acidimicrobiales bacterium]